MIDYNQIEIGDIVVGTFRHGSKIHHLILEELDDGLYNTYCVETEEYVVFDCKFDPHMIGSKYEIIKPKK